MGFYTFSYFLIKSATIGCPKGRVASSSVARGGWVAICTFPLIDMSTKMQNGKNTTFLALLRLFFELEWTK